MTGSQPRWYDRASWRDTGTRRTAPPGIAADAELRDGHPRSKRFTPLRSAEPPARHSRPARQARPDPRCSRSRSMWPGDSRPGRSPPGVPRHRLWRTAEPTMSLPTRLPATGIWARRFHALAGDGQGRHLATAQTPRSARPGRSSERAADRDADWDCTAQIDGGPGASLNLRG